MTDYKQKAASYAKKYKLDPNVFTRQIGAESNGNPRAKSPAGAQGIAQIMPATAKSWGINPNNPDQSLDAAAQHMAQYVKQFGSMEAALRAYNAGPGAVEKSKGFAETNAYVKKILGNSPSSFDTLNASSSGGMTGTSSDTPSAYDVIRQYNDATAPANPTGLEDQMTTTQDMIMKAAQGQSVESVAPSVASMGDSSTGGISGLTGDEAARANTIDKKHLPYLWGGGHGGKVNPSAATPLDCSGAVSAVLGLDPRVSGAFAQWGKPGRAKGGKGTTVYANDKHVLMEIDGHFFGTSSTNPGGGAGWIPRSAISDEYLKGFTARHS